MVPVLQTSKIILLLFLLQAIQTLDSTEGIVGSLGSLLNTLNSRLDSLQTQIEQNLRDLGTARNLTAIAVQVANQTEVVSGCCRESVCVNAVW